MPGTSAFCNDLVLDKGRCLACIVRFVVCVASPQVPVHGDTCGNDYKILARGWLAKMPPTVIANGEQSLSHVGRLSGGLCVLCMLVHVGESMNLHWISTFVSFS